MPFTLSSILENHQQRSDRCPQCPVEDTLRSLWPQPRAHPQRFHCQRSTQSGPDTHAHRPHGRADAVANIATSDVTILLAMHIARRIN